MRVDGDALGAVVSLVDAHQMVGQLVHFLGDDEELNVPKPILDVVSQDGDVLGVQGGYYLVHDIKRCRLEVTESEVQGK